MIGFCCHDNLRTEGISVKLGTQMYNDVKMNCEHGVNGFKVSLGINAVAALTCEPMMGF